MKPIIQISAVFLMITILSACGSVKNTQVQQSEKKNNQTPTSTQEEIRYTTGEEPFFVPRYPKFHMAPISSDPSKPLTLKFPLITNKIKNVSVKVYKINKEHFIELIKQQVQPEHEGKLNISSFSNTERKPIFSGIQDVHETEVYPSEPQHKKSYIEITMLNDGVQYNQGYYYFEFDSATSSETLEPISGMPMNSLLEVVETYSSYEGESN